MDERGNQDFQDLDNPAPTGSQSNRRPPRPRGARAQRKPTQTKILTENYSRRPPSQRQAGHPGQLADHETLRPRVIEGVVALIGRALDGNSKTETKTRAGYVREAVNSGHPLGSGRAVGDHGKPPGQQPEKGRECAKKHNLCVRLPGKTRDPSTLSPRTLRR
ncbi:hypothetical protein TIFTF001_021629 [Ficus carica]|uniref:Uncharacterized protein n=1 Tax=Ficus carica TaxID=3494 RepID=A0AA88DDT3_FICCA|nr:hypothetical protein TIFTF001_021629 [Ficus carica]